MTLLTETHKLSERWLYAVDGVTGDWHAESEGFPELITETDSLEGEVQRLRERVENRGVLFNLEHDKLVKAEARAEAAETMVFLLEKCLDDYCPQIGMTVSFRQYFYTILGHYPEWIEPPKNMGHFERWRDEVLSKRGVSESG